MGFVKLTNLQKPLPMPQQKKTCNKCGAEKEMELFRKSERYVDFRSNTCRSCEKKRQDELASRRKEYSENYFVHTDPF